LTREKALSNTYHFTRNTTEDSLRWVLYSGLAQYYYDQALFRKCIRSAQLAIPPTCALKDTAGWFALLTMQTEAYVRTGDFDGARQSIRTCLEVAEKQGSPERLAAAYNNMGALYHHMRDDSFSIVMYRKGLETLRRIPASESLPMRAELLRSHRTFTWGAIGVSPISLVAKAMTVRTDVARSLPLRIALAAARTGFIATPPCR